MDPFALIFVFLGLLSVAGAGFNWDWFMELRRARFITRALGGREKARIFYYLLGAGFIIFGLLAFFRVINLN